MSSSAPSTTAQPPARSSTKASRLVQGSPHHLPLDVVLTKVKSNLRNARQQNQDLARQHKALMEERESLLVKVKAQDSLLGAALREGNSILISPLPKSTTKNSAFKPLPRVDEGEEEEEESYDGSEEYDEEKDSDADILQPVMDLVKTPLAITDVPRLSDSPLSITPLSSPPKTSSASPILAASLEQLLTSRLSAVATRVPTRSQVTDRDAAPNSSRSSSRSVSPARPIASTSRSRLPAQPSQSSLVPYQAPTPPLPRSTLASQPPPVNDGLRFRLHDILGRKSSSPPQSPASTAAARAGCRRTSSRSPELSSSDSRRYPSQARSPYANGVDTVEQVSRLIQSNAPSGSAERHRRLTRGLSTNMSVSKEWSRMNKEIKKPRSPCNGDRTAPGSPSYTEFHYSLHVASDPFSYTSVYRTARSSTRRMLRLLYDSGHWLAHLPPPPRVQLPSPTCRDGSLLCAANLRQPWITVPNAKDALDSQSTSGQGKHAPQQP
ncbi:hypothetical protein BKA70DRAFT_1450509 [Coprinopsis sp. MPI-PUGE-AT-0042]|nr:hypothetical protein BKA70DRAFT_1450509 [Coprinopsis sp. MPI-PUGE-AT-0042]